MKASPAVQLEIARFIARNMPFATIATPFGIWVFVFVLAPAGNANNLILWASVFSVTAAHAYYCLKSSPLLDEQNAGAWLRQAAVLNGIASFILGVGAFAVLAIPIFDYHLIFLYGMFIIAVSSIFSYGPHYLTLICMVVPVTIITAIALALHPSFLHRGMAVIEVLIAVVALYFGRTFNRVFIRNLELRFENIGLVSQLRAQKEAAENANLSKSRFLAAASHDLRQPMHALNLYLGAMSNAPTLEEAKPLLDNASECAYAMDDMFRALLDVSSLDAGAVKPDLSVFPIASVMERVRLAYAPAAHDKGLRLNVAPCSTFVHSDAALVERILGNLVSNAVRYTEKGCVLVGCRRRGNTLSIQVHDTGRGISADKQALIFEEFYQVGNAERDRSKGLGLGLAIVERLARLLDIPVSLRSRSGKGSMFSFDLPRALGRRPVGTAEDRAFLVEVRDTFIVIVDDEKLILDATRAVLEQHGAFVLTAISRTDVLRQVGHSRRIPDALICDYRLRAGETGLQVIEAIREEFNADIPAMLITGDTSPERLRELKASGLAVMHKPIQEKEFLDSLCALIASKRTMTVENETRSAA